MGILSLALSNGYSPAVVVDHDRDVIGIIERPGSTLERLVIELPLRRRRLPNQLREITAILLVALPAPVGREVELVPPLQLCGGRQRNSARFLTRDEVAADRHHRL